MKAERMAVAKMPGRRVFGIALLLTVLAGCAVTSRWHWEKRGASEGDYEVDEKACKLQSYSGTEGMVTNESVRRMHRCMESRGWRKVDN